MKIDSNSALPYRYLGLTLGKLGELEEAIDGLKTALLLSKRHHWKLADVAGIYSSQNNLTEIELIYNELKSRSLTEYISPLYLAATAHFSGKKDEAYEFAEQAIRQRYSQLVCCMPTYGRKKQKKIQDLKI